MSAVVDLDWTYRGMRTIVLENELLRVVILPELGAKIWQITYKPRGKDMLWHNPRLKPRPLPLHANYDDQFFGGWDELFPNDAAETIEGEAYPDHGEIWTLPWQFRVVRDDPHEVEVKLWVDTPISACRVEKTIALRAGESKLRFRHTIANGSRKPLPFLWKLHAAMAADEHCRIDLPARSVYVEQFGSPRADNAGSRYEWPYAVDAAGNRHDMRRALPASSGASEFQYATDTEAGWCALTHTADRVGFGLAYDQAVLPHCWLFASYGGWRELNTVVLEPCTGYPYSVNEGIAQGTQATLAPGEMIACEVVAVVYEGLTSVSSIDADGNVQGCRD